MYNVYHYLMNNLKIRTKIILFLVISLVLYTALLSCVILVRTENVLNKESGEAMMQVMDQINNNIDYNINKFEISMKSFYAGDRFDVLIPEVINDYNDMLLFFNAVGKQITTFRTINEEINDLRIFSFDDKIPWDNVSIFSGSEISREQWVKSLMDNKAAESFYWTDENDGTWTTDIDEPALHCYTTVFNAADRRLMAILRLDVSTKRIFSTVDKVTFGKSGLVFVAKDTGELIYYENSKMQYLGDYKSKISEVISKDRKKEAGEGIFTADIGGQKEFLVYSNKNELGWYIIGSMPHEEFGEKTKDTKNLIVELSLGLCTFAFISTFLFSKLVTKRITRLSETINSLVERGFKVVEEIPGNDEVGQVFHQIKKMAKRIKELVDEVEEHYKKEKVLLNEKYELEMLKKEAELCALQTQINPHFLYNTLETIRGLLFSEDPKGNIIKATRALSNVFRYNLNTGYKVKVKDEIKHIKDYLAIHNLRFSKGISLINEMDEQMMEAVIVRFTFEPIVENAIIHGFKTSKRDNIIHISSRVEDNKNVIFIKDNGIGMPSETLEKVRKRLLNEGNSFMSDRKVGLGIYNVNARIKRNFGAGYGIDISSIEGESTAVIIRLPVNHDQNSSF